MKVVVAAFQTGGGFVEVGDSGVPSVAPSEAKSCCIANGVIQIWRNVNNGYTTAVRVNQISTADATALEIHRLMQALDALANPSCCRGVGTSLFQVMNRDGRPTGEEVRLCNGCGRELA